MGKLVAASIITAVIAFACTDSLGQQAMSTTPGTNSTVDSLKEHVRHIRARKKPRFEPEIMEEKETSKLSDKGQTISARQSKAVAHQLPGVSAKSAAPKKAALQTQKSNKKTVLKQETINRPTQPVAASKPPRGFFEELFEDN